MNRISAMGTTMQYCVEVDRKKERNTKIYLYVGERHQKKHKKPRKAKKRNTQPLKTKKEKKLGGCQDLWKRT